MVTTKTNNISIVSSCWFVALLLLLLVGCGGSSFAFSPPVAVAIQQRQQQQSPLPLPPRRERRGGVIGRQSLWAKKTTTKTSPESMETNTNTNDNDNNQEETAAVVYITQSTLALLEHVNLNVPNHEYCLDFYYRVLGCGMDPRKASNLRPNAPKKTLWANCGASQFHLPQGTTPQVLRGHIGLFYDDDNALSELETRLNQYPHCYQSYERDSHCIRITDQYGNQFVARASNNQNNNRLAQHWKQPVITKQQQPKDMEQWGDIALEYGIDNDHTICRGIDYVEFHCPVGTAATIALFYEKVFEASTTVLPAAGKDNTNDEQRQVAIIAFGNISPQGRADQSLIYRESNQPLPSYDGHHIALYVGQSAEDFDQAYLSCEMAGVVWINPRFDDKANSLYTARKYRQFRFQDIVDLNTGKVVYQVEHEVRSVLHEAWPGTTTVASSSQGMNETIHEK